MDIFDELAKMDRERENRPLPEQSKELPKFTNLLPEASDLGTGWTEVSTRISDERTMRRTQRVYASRRYLHDKIPPFEEDLEEFSLAIEVHILPSAEDALAEIGHVAIDADEMKASEQWDHGFYGTLWTNCIAYPRDPGDFNDLMVAFPFDRAMWRIRSRGPHAMRWAHFVYTQRLGATIPKPD